MERISGVKLLHASIHSTVSAIFLGNSNQHRKTLLACVIAATLWTIWISRNGAAHEEKIDVDAVLSRGRAFLRTWSAAIRGTPPEDLNFDLFRQLATALPRNQPSPRGEWIKWIAPPAGFKLNTDGSVRNGVMTGGGVVRDSQGAVRLAFSARWQSGSVIVAEARALLLGLRLVGERGLAVAELEVDANILLQAISNYPSCSWHLCYWVRAIKALLQPFQTTTHIWRQGNMLADALAAIGHEGPPLQIFDSVGSLPNHCKQIAREDSLGLYYFRPP